MAYSFDAASTQYIAYPQGDVPAQGDAFTFAVRFYGPTGASTGHIWSYSRSTSASPLRRLRWNTGFNRLNILDRSDANVNIEYFTTGATLARDVWESGQYVRPNGSSRTVYLNAANSNTNTTTQTTSTFDRLTLGVFWRSTGAEDEPFGGRIAEFALWDVDLTTDELISLHKGFKPSRIRPQSLTAYVPLVRELQDVRTARTLTNVNGATVIDHPRVY
jgi:hypothetical protein